MSVNTAILIAVCLIVGSAAISAFLLPRQKD